MSGAISGGLLFMSKTARKTKILLQKKKKMLRNNDLKQIY